MGSVSIVCTDDEDMPVDALTVAVRDVYAPTDIHGRLGHTVSLRLTVPAPAANLPDLDDLTLIFDTPEDAAAVLLRWNVELSNVIERMAAEAPRGDAA